jgi:hypothetical protein
MTMNRRLNEIERLRALQQRPQRDLSIEGIIRATAETARKTQKRLGSIIDLWEELVPQELAARTRIDHIRGGTLHVSVDSSSTAYELDRLLRESLERDLRSPLSRHAAACSIAHRFG